MPGTLRPQPTPFANTDTFFQNAKIAAGGYSQGTAVAAGAIEQLPSQIRERVGAAVLFGYTRNKQNKQRIPNYPLDRTQSMYIPGVTCMGTDEYALRC